MSLVPVSVLSTPATRRKSRHTSLRTTLVLLLRTYMSSNATCLGASHDCSDGCICLAGLPCQECCSCVDQPAFDFDSIAKKTYRFARPSVAFPSTTQFTGCSCRGHFLMSPTTNMLSTEMSECTKREICMAVEMYGSCLSGKWHVLKN